MMRKTMTRFMAAALAAGVLSTGCYGSFGATVALHKWNGQVTGNKFLNELVFLALCIVPVYELFGLADVLVLNSIEFWTGSHPVGSAELKPVELPDGSVAVRVGEHELRLVPKTDGSTRVLVDGRPAGILRMAADGSLALEDTLNDRLVTVGPEQLAELRTEAEARYGR
jgi:hypothetical protein